MLFRRKLPNKAIIFKKSGKQAYSKKLFNNYKTMISFKTFGIVTTGALLVLTGVLAYKPTLVPAPTVKEAQKTAPLTQSHGKVLHGDGYDGSDNGYYDTSAYGDNGSDYNNYNSNGYYDIQPISVSPLLNNYDSYSYVNPSISYANTQPGSGINGIASQLLANQQNTTNQMQSCINNARQMANQLNALKSQEVQVQHQLDSLNNQLSNIDTSTPGGQQRQDALNSQIRQLQNKIDQIDNTGSQGESNYNNQVNKCQQTVSQLEQHREDLESQLDNNFSDSLNNIQIP
ncbi:MAG: hypothetical protein ACREHC_07215 [Candidatus Levyibacteriota bacterium]